MTPSPRSDRPRVYADEDIDRALIEALRARGFDVLTVQITRSFGEDDPAQLERAAALGRVLLTFNSGTSSARTVASPGDASARPSRV